MTKNEIVITRILNAPRERVFQAWTDPEMIKQWWGPKGFSAPKIKIDLRVGGTYHFCMHGLEGDFKGQDLWSGGVYKEIVKNERIVCTDYFSNEAGDKITPAEFGATADFPEESLVTVTFEEHHGKTKLSIHYAPENKAAHDAMVKMGMVEGWNSSLDKLVEVVEA